MKKRYIFFTMILSIFFLSISNNKTLASFYIQDFEINSEVFDNGDMKVEENITYYSTETKNGVTREINLKNATNINNSADGLNLLSVKIDGIEARKVNIGNIGDDGVYEYSSSNNTHNLKVYVPFRRIQTRTITYEYLLKNVCVKYNDTSEIFWNFIGDQWDTKIDKLTINIKLPEKAIEGTTYVFGHGSDNGTFSKYNNNISLYANDLKANQALDARILFSTSALPNTTKVINKNVLNKYINQEEGLTSKIEEPEIIFGLKSKELAIIISSFLIIFWIIIYFKYDKEIKVDKKYYYRDIPCNLEPEILQRIYYGKKCKDSFWITFLNLVKMGVYKIEESTNEVGKKVKLIVYQGKENKKLKGYQNDIIDIINGFFENDENSIDLDKLNAKMKMSTGSKYLSFQNNLESEYEGIFGDKSKVSKKPCLFGILFMIIMIIIIGIVSTKINADMSTAIIMFLGITSFVYTLVFSVIPINISTISFLAIHFLAFEGAIIGMMIVLGIFPLYIPYIISFIFVQYAQRIRKYSKEEREIREQIKGLRRYIRDYSKISERDIESIVIWEDYLIIAIALKLNNKTINYFYDYCKESINNEFGSSLNSFGSYYYMDIACHNTFNNYIRSYNISHNSSSGSSYSGSHGGFSGGSSFGGRRTAEVEEEAPSKITKLNNLNDYSAFNILN